MKKVIAAAFKLLIAISVSGQLSNGYFTIYMITEDGPFFSPVPEYAIRDHYDSIVYHTLEQYYLSEEVDGVDIYLIGSHKDEQFEYTAGYYDRRDSSIVLILDNFLWREMLVEVLFHEIGHHLWERVDHSTRAEFTRNYYQADGDFTLVNDPYALDTRTADPGEHMWCESFTDVMMSRSRRGSIWLQKAVYGSVIRTLDKYNISNQRPVRERMYDRIFSHYCMYNGIRELELPPTEGVKMLSYDYIELLERLSTGMYEIPTSDVYRYKAHLDDFTIIVDSANLIITNPEHKILFRGYLYSLQGGINGRYVFGEKKKQYYNPDKRAEIWYNEGTATLKWQEKEWEYVPYQ